MENDRDNNQLNRGDFPAFPCLTNSLSYDQHVKRPYFEQQNAMGNPHAKIASSWIIRTFSSQIFAAGRWWPRFSGLKPLTNILTSHWRTYLPLKHPTWVQQGVWLNFCFVIHICLQILLFQRFHICFLVNLPFFLWFLDVHPVKSTFFIGEIAIFAMEFFQLRLLVQSLFVTYVSHSFPIVSQCSKSLYPSIVLVGL